MNINDILGKIIFAVVTVLTPILSFYIVRVIKTLATKIKIDFIRDQVYNLVWAAEQMFESNIDKFGWVDEFLEKKLKIKDPDDRRRFIEEAVLNLKKYMTELIPKKGGKSGIGTSQRALKEKPKSPKK